MIPDEAVEAAVKARRETPYWGDTIMSVLEAAAPHLMATAWDEAHFEALGCDGSCCDLMHNAPRKSTNPYRSQP